MDTLIENIRSFSALEKDSLDELMSKLERVEYSKSDLIAKQGGVCHYLYFLEKGCIRGFYNLDGKEITHWFAFENDFVTSFHSFITGKTAFETVQTLEDSVLWRISKSNLTGLYDNYPDVERLGRRVCEEYYIRLEERYVSAQFKTAAERYDQLSKSNYSLINRVQLGYIASYLGISQETLSRIRAKAL